MDEQVSKKVETYLVNINERLNGIDQRFAESQQQSKRTVERLNEVKTNVFKAIETHWTRFLMEVAEIDEYIQGEENFQLKLTANAKVAQEEQRRLERAIQQIGVENSQIQRKIQKYTDDKDKVVELTEIDREKIKVREASINQKENRLDRQTRVEEKMIENYQKVLGLSIVPCEDQSLQFTFKFIDKRQPKAEYHVVIETSDSRTFEASHCEPMIPEVEYLRTALKEERIDLPKFIRDVRAAFVRHAEAEAKHRKRT